MAASSSRTAPFSAAHLVYVVLASIVACSAIAWAVAVRPELFLDVFSRQREAFLLLLALGLASRLLSFPVASIGTVSLDTGIYVAAVVTMGTGPGVLLVLAAMLLRNLVEVFRREVIARRHWPAWVSFVKVLFGPSVTAAVLLAIGLAFRPAVPFGRSVDVSVTKSALVFLAVTAGFVLPQYAIVLASYRLNGLRWRRMTREILLPGLLGEAAFMPLGFALAIAYKGRDVPALGALAVSYVIFSYIFKRMWQTSEAAREQARELGIVEEAGRAASSTLDLGDMARRIGISALRAIQGASGVVLTLVGPDGSEPRTFVRAGDRASKPALLAAVERDLAARSGGPDAPPPDGREADGGARLGRVHSIDLCGQSGTVQGHLSLVMHEDAEASARDLRILESLARQASIAAENIRLYGMATEDGLTGLFVRRYLEARMIEEFERASRSGTSFCVLMIDVDNLKTANDVHGHAAGDLLLKAVAAAVRESVRAMDVAARWGGDEFAAILPDMDLAAGMGVAHRMAEAVKRHSFRVDGVEVHPSASVGVAAYPESGPKDPPDLLELADRALYSVKKSGRKGTVVAAEGPAGRTAG